MHGRSESTLKKHNWALIDRLRDVSPLPWLLGSDFNEILTLSEKQGGSRKHHHHLTDFCECLLRNNLADCKPSRGWFTWKQSGPRVAPIRERLDHFFAGREWFSCFPTFRAWSEYSPNSDHHFILLDTVTDSVPPEARGKSSTFRFDDCWAHESDCVTLVQTLWVHSTRPFADRLSAICDGLCQWQSSKRLADWGRIPKLRSKINRLSSRQFSPGELEILLAAKGELRHLLNVYEAYWAQRSRVLWLSFGDHNTSFFHAKASARRRKNEILGLYHAQGQWKASTGDVLRIASDYFVELFSAGPSAELCFPGPASLLAAYLWFTARFSLAYSLLSKLGELTFTTEEQDAVVVTLEAVAIPAEDFASSLVGKVVSPSTIDGNCLIRLFRSIWKDDKKYWFALEQADPNRTINDYSFQHMCICVRIHNIPLNLMTVVLARVLGASIGKVIMTDTRLEDGNMGEFMRVRVSFDTTKPLRRCVVLSRPDAKASMCPLQYERLPLFFHGCGLLGHSVLVFPTTPKVEGQKFQYGAWLRAPFPKRSISQPRGRISLVEDDMDILVPAHSASDGPPIRDEPAEAHAPVSDPVAPAVAAPVTKAPSAPVAETDADNLRNPLPPSEVADLVENTVDEPLDPENSETAADRSAPEDTPYDPMVHTETSDMLEEALEISRDCVLIADLTGVIQANGEDLVNEAIPEATDSIFRDVAASIFGASTSAAATVASSRPNPTPVASPPNPGHSRSAPASSRRAAMPVVPEHHEFDAWCAAQPRTPLVAMQNQPTVARNSTIPPLRPHKRQASSFVTTLLIASLSWAGLLGCNRVLELLLSGNGSTILLLVKNGFLAFIHSIFCFDDCWAHEPDCVTLVKTFWAHSTGPFAARLSTVCDGLRQWQSSKHVVDWGRIPKLRSEINRLSSRRLNPEDLEALLAAKGELHHLLNVQEVYWTQRSRVLWLPAGDRNTSFFHAKASARRRKNAIVGIYDAQGHCKASTGDVLHIASDYFVELFSAGLFLGPLQG
ncbi:hypothetical protein GQ457_16G018230 [Hibiscus cannabinus]